MDAPGRVPWRRVVIPAEHGGWALLGEPILLGLWTVWSPAGLLLALAAVAAFLARTPLRLAAGDRRRGRRYPRTAQAEAAFAVLATVSAAALAGSVMLGHGPVLRVLALAAPLAALALALDLAARAREAAVEVLSAVALASIAAAIAVAGGRPLPAALGLWAVLACRAAPTVLYVRARLRLDRGEAAGVIVPLTAHVAAIAAVSLLVASGLVPPGGVIAMALLMARAAWGLSPVRPRLRTAWLGVTEIAFGLATVALVRFGFR